MDIFYANKSYTFKKNIYIKGGVKGGKRSGP